MKDATVVIHCQPDYLDKIKELGYNWSYSPLHGKNEIDVIVDDVPYEIVYGIYQDPDEQLCEHYVIDYDKVNCIEAL